VFAFAFDGVYIGATWARDRRNLMVASSRSSSRHGLRCARSATPDYGPRCWCIMRRAAGWSMALSGAAQEVVRVIRHPECEPCGAIAPLGEPRRMHGHGPSPFEAALRAATSG